MDKVFLITNKDDINKIKSQLPFVFRLIVDNEGIYYGLIGKKFNEKRESAIKIAKDISLIMFKVFPSASNIQSTIGIINKEGKHQFNISANFKHLYEINVTECLNIWQVNKGENIFLLILILLFFLK